MQTYTAMWKHIHIIIYIIFCCLNIQVQKISQYKAYEEGVKNNVYHHREFFFHLTSEKRALHHTLTMQEEGPVLRKQASAISL